MVWWRERDEFISSDQMGMAQMGRSSLLFLQASIHACENSYRKDVSRAAMWILDPETMEPFARAQLFEWLSNRRLSHWNEQDFGKDLRDVTHQVQMGQETTISMN